MIFVDSMVSIIYSLEKQGRQKQEDEERNDEQMNLLMPSEEEITLRGMYLNSL